VGGVFLSLFYFFYWVCLFGVVWRVFLVCFVSGLLLNSTCTATELLGRWFRVFWGCYRWHVAHLLVQEEPATMLLVLLRFLQQSWHTMIQPRVLWVAPRVLTPSVSHSAHVPMVWVWGWMVIKVSVVVGSSLCAPFG